MIQQLLDCTNTPAAQPLPTSRYARHPARSVLAILRAAAPPRRLSRPHSLIIAELQANLLLEMAGHPALPIPTELITQLPRIAVASDEELPNSAMTLWLTAAGSSPSVEASRPYVSASAWPTSSSTSLTTRYSSASTRIECKATQPPTTSRPACGCPSVRYSAPGPRASRRLPSWLPTSRCTPVPWLVVWSTSDCGLAVPIRRCQRHYAASCRRATSGVPTEAANEPGRHARRDRRP